MVSVDRDAYLKPFMEDAVTREFINFLNSESVCEPDGARLSSTKEMTIVALKSIQTNSKVKYDTVIQEISRRRITEDVDWIYDDFLLFALVIGACIFRGNKDFLGQICQHRMSVQTGKDRELATTFSAVLQGHKDGPAKYLLLVCKTFIDDSDFDLQLVNSAFIEASALLSSAVEPPFRRLIALKAHDSAVLLKGLNDCESLQMQKRFLLKFDSRSRNFCQYYILFNIDFHNDYMDFSGLPILARNSESGIRGGKAFRNWYYYCPLGIII